MGIAPQTRARSKLTNTLLSPVLRTVLYGKTEQNQRFTTANTKVPRLLFFIKTRVVKLVAMYAPPPTTTTTKNAVDTEAQAPSKCSCMEITSIILFSCAILLGIGSFASTVVAEKTDDDYYNYDDDYNDGATISAISLGTISMILAIVAVPLAFVAARAYLRTRQKVMVGASYADASGRPAAGWTIAAWIVYGIVILNGVCALIVGAVGGTVPSSWVAAMVLLLVLGWGLMVTYAELARRRTRTTSTSTTSVVPTTDDNATAVQAEVTADSFPGESHYPGTPSNIPSTSASYQPELRVTQVSSAPSQFAGDLPSNKDQCRSRIGGIPVAFGVAIDDDVLIQSKAKSPDIDP